MFSSLRARLLISYALLVGVVLCVVGLGLLVFIVQNPLVDRQTINRLERALQTTLDQRELTGALLANREEALRRLDERFQARFLLYSADLGLLVDSRRETEAALNTPGAAALRQGRGLVRDANGQAWMVALERLPAGVLLVAAAPRTGGLALLGSGTFREVLRDDLLPPLVRAGLLALLAALVLALLMARWISDPLGRMEKAARGMADGVYAPIPASGPDEVRGLALALNEMGARVQASQLSQRDFVANVSHELKTPLTSIQGFAQAMLDGAADTPESRQQAAQIIYDETGRMHRMVVELLELARLDSGIAGLQRSPLDLGTLLRSILEKFEPQAGRLGVVLQPEISPLPPLTGDADRLAQVFTNLVDNAIQHTPQGQAVTLRARQIGSEVEVSVEDQGPGIPHEDLERIFERFYQVDKARPSRVQRGYGLGLAIAREIVLAHGGIIQAFSNTHPDLGTQGSVFMVKLPLVQARQSPDRQSSVKA